MRAGPTSPAELKRELGLSAATFANIVAMIGAGPFITIPLLLETMGGPQAMLGWVIGAAIAMCDGLAWAELGAAIPQTGGGYRYILESYGPKGLGRLMGFLCLWPTVIITPLIIASCAIGFSGYATYLCPAMTPTYSTILAVFVCLLATQLVYRRIGSVGRWGIAFGLVVLGVALWVIGEGAMHATREHFALPAGALQLSSSFWTGLGGATLYAMYDYAGYQTVCSVGGEVINPEHTIPRAVLLSVVIVCALYLAMNFSIIGVLPWREAIHSKFVVSEFVARLHGPRVAAIMTVLILVVIFSSIFAGLLGASRVQYAAAKQGQFFRVFARLHQTGHFPSFSVLYMGIASAFCCLFPLDALIQAGTVIAVMSQSIPTVVAVVVFRARRPDVNRPFRMWLYPVPIVVALGGWVYIVATVDWPYTTAALGVLLFGAIGYVWRARLRHEWPWIAATPQA